MSTFWHALQFIARNGQVAGSPVQLPSLVHLTLVTLEYGALAVAISIVIGLPVGLVLGHIHRGSFVAINLGNIWRSLPSLAVLAIGAAFLGLTLTNVLLALVVLAVPPIVTNAYVAVDGVDPDLTDAARGMGLAEWQILLRVELPVAIPLLMAGVRTAALFVISTVTIAALAGFSGTLGDIVVNEATYRLSGVVGAAICIATLALGTEVLLAGVQWAITPAALRGGGGGSGGTFVPAVADPLEHGALLHQQRRTDDVQR